MPVFRPHDSADDYAAAAITVLQALREKLNSQSGHRINSDWLRRCKKAMIRSANLETIVGKRGERRLRPL
jgi:hypothetical protein